MKHPLFRRTAIAAACMSAPLCAIAQEARAPINVVVVSATRDARPVTDVPASLDVLDAILEDGDAGPAPDGQPADRADRAARSGQDGRSCHAR